ncbi:MAG: hypothetical protein IPP73_00955 [Chitinophagaceae bacterium]|nr:hypothetical protein [Chitinophagaceae bacterium]
MKLSLMLCGLCLVTLLACQKDKFTTTPQVSLKSITPSSVVIGDIIRVKGTFTDKEGDVDSAYIIYKWYNGANIVKNDTFATTCPHWEFLLPPKTAISWLNFLTAGSKLVMCN